MPRVGGPCGVDEDALALPRYAFNGLVPESVYGLPMSLKAAVLTAAHGNTFIFAG